MRISLTHFEIKLFGGPGTSHRRRNPSDNSTDMNSFPFVRHHFLRAGFEVIDCPPLTAQLKNSSDIRMVMDRPRPTDARHLLRRVHHPVGRCRLHAGAASPAGACPAHGDLRQRFHGGALHGDQRRRGARGRPDRAACSTATAESARHETPATPRWRARSRRSEEVRARDPGRGGRRGVRAVADARCRSRRWPTGRCARSATSKTIATGWAGAGSFRELLRQRLPDEIRLTGGSRPTWPSTRSGTASAGRIGRSADGNARAPAASGSSQLAPAEPPLRDAEPTAAIGGLAPQPRYRGNRSSGPVPQRAAAEPAPCAARRRCCRRSRCS